ncbi:MAG TPA: hypothetical protein VF933_20975 [Streptosporangiaceae bacterium]
MADSGWIAVVGVIVGGSLAGTIGLLQARSQNRFDTMKAKEDRGYKEITEQRAALMQVFTRYQLAADRLENAIRELAPTRLPATPERGMGASKNMPSGNDSLEAYEAAQQEYDEVCQILQLAAPLRTVEVALQQRQMFNQFAREALDGSYNHDASFKLIVQRAQPVLTAMRQDLSSPE